MMIELRNVCKTLLGKRVLDEVSFDVGAGEVVALCGPSGAGKTTLLRAINGLDDIDSGLLRVAGQDLSRRSHRRRSLGGRVGMMFQHFNLFSHLNALDNITLAPRKVLGEQRAAAEARARALLERLGLADKASHMADQLSGGEKQRVALARCLAMKPDVMLFDEPTSALDSERRDDVAELIASLRHTHVTMVVVTHDREFAASIADRELAIEAGRVMPPRVCCATLRQRLCGAHDVQRSLQSNQAVT